MVTFIKKISQKNLQNFRKTQKKFKENFKKKSKKNFFFYIASYISIHFNCLSFHRTGSFLLLFELILFFLTIYLDHVHISQPLTPPTLPIFLFNHLHFLYRNIFIYSLSFLVVYFFFLIKNH